MIWRMLGLVVMVSQILPPVDRRWNNRTNGFRST